MLQVERQNQLRNGKPSVDFVSRNKRAVRPTKTGSRGDTIKKMTHPPQQPLPARSKFRQPSLQQKRDKQIKPTESANTVVVSKQYLDELLRMSVMREDVKGGNTVTHVSLDPSQVPGLESTIASNTSSTHQKPVNQTPVKPLLPNITNDQESPPNYQAAHHGNQGKEQWLNDLAIQAMEQRQRKKSEKMRQKQTSPEEYFPFGRPGGGAPIRSQSGQLLTNYRFRSQMGGAPNASSSPKHTNETSHGSQYVDTSVNSPPNNAALNFPQPTTNQISPSGGNGLMIGASPQNTSTTPRFARGAGPFVDQYVLQDMEEKRKKQMEHMMFIHEQVAAKERAKMEERLRKEREEAIEEARLAKEREQMKMEHRRERERVRQKELDSLKHQALLQSRIAEAEESARQAKQVARSKHTTRNTQSVAFSDTQHHMINDHCHMTDVHHLVPAKFNSTLRSPSLMQLSAESATDLITKHSAGDTILTTDNRRPLKLRRVENNSEKTRQRVGGEVKRVSRIPVLTRPTATTAGDVVGRKQRAVKNEINKPGRKYVPIKRERSPSPVFIRAASPPVPALAKRLDRHQPRDDPLISVHDPPPSHSPPVPALAKKLAHNMSHDDYVTYKKMCVSVRDSPLRNTVIPPKSPPVPALAKSLLAHDTSKSSTNVPSHSVNDDVISNDHTHSSDIQFPINRPPSCSLVVVPIPSLHSTPITKETSDKRNCFQLAPSTSRQNLILQELAILREGILSQRSTMDNRVDRILSRKKCTF